jgi:hypothetical protein
MFGKGFFAGFGYFFAAELWLPCGLDSPIWPGASVLNLTSAGAAISLHYISQSLAKWPKGGWLNEANP